MPKRIRFPRWVWRKTGISSFPIGRCDCDQDYCLVCEIKFRFWFRVTRHLVKKG